jgi:hypothetical protein
VYCTTKRSEYLKSKTTIGTLALIVGTLALAFALFGWTQGVHPLFGGYARYMCALGGLGATISGALMLESSLINEKSAQIAQVPELEFIVTVDEEEHIVST